MLFAGIVTAVLNGTVRGIKCPTMTAEGNGGMVIVVSRGGDRAVFFFTWTVMW